MTLGSHFLLLVAALFNACPGISPKHSELKPVTFTAKKFNLVRMLAQLSQADLQALRNIYDPEGYPIGSFVQQSQRTIFVRLIMARLIY